MPYNITTILLQYYVITVRYTERTELRKVRLRRADPWITAALC